MRTLHTIKAAIINKNQLVYKIMKLSYAPDGVCDSSVEVGEFHSESAAVTACSALNKWTGEK